MCEALSSISNASKKERSEREKGEEERGAGSSLACSSSERIQVSESRKVLPCSLPNGNNPPGSHSDEWNNP